MHFGSRAQQSKQNHHKHYLRLKSLSVLQFLARFFFFILETQRTGGVLHIKPWQAPAPNFSSWMAFFSLFFFYASAAAAVHSGCFQHEQDDLIHVVLYGLFILDCVKYIGVDFDCLHML